MSKENFLTPILLIAYNRPSYTVQVFNKIKEIKPAYLYVAADGPKPNNPQDFQKCMEVRKIFEKIDWPCKINKLYSETNQGCKYGPYNGINWFFENENSGIILEDDCLPHNDFFRFCEEMLLEYSDNNNIMLISGFNFFNTWKNNSISYFFSFYGGTWGWATWKRAWNKCDIELKRFPEILKKTNDYFPSKKQSKYWINYFKYIIKEKGDYWDFYWFFTRILFKGLSIVPTKNLVINIGFGTESTHTQTMHPLFQKIESNALDYPIKKNYNIEADKNYDEKLFNSFYKKTNTIERIKMKWLT